MAMLKLTCYKISRLPDFLTAKYTSLYGGEVRGKVLEAQQAFLMMLHSLESEGGDLGVSIKYVYDPNAPSGQRTSIYLFFRNELGFENEELCNIIQNSRLGVFYPFFPKGKETGIIEHVQLEDVPEYVLNPDKYEYAIEITKEEAFFDSVLSRYEILDDNLKDSPFSKVPYYFIYPF